jgi:hypothetical protein
MLNQGLSNHKSPLFEKQSASLVHRSLVLNSNIGLSDQNELNPLCQQDHPLPELFIPWSTSRGQLYPITPRTMRRQSAMSKTDYLWHQMSRAIKPLHRSRTDLQCEGFSKLNNPSAMCVDGTGESEARAHVRNVMHRPHCFLFIFLNHTAFKLYSLWHVGSLLDDFYRFDMCSRVSLSAYIPTRCPGFVKAPRLLDSLPSH